MPDVISTYTHRIAPQPFVEGYSYQIETEGLIKAPFMQTFLPVALHALSYIALMVITVLILRSLIQKFEH